ncbi:D-alanine--D-alanine ligase [Psychroflexus montanilacus]|uniref:D-alanine--D-alanine ligase n=1 Tax=Psychroflexus montanilacus TaxID=2873598 RepID=UPI001CCF30EC|nr:D-alanine--D-alanine ligase [Psychroflexus montanilacus]MBZ9652989.1 D-alanine--D-alanine ligase [Psychroflexus montanilacus]
MKKTIAVAMGGYSSEAEISLKSGEVVYKHLSANPKFDVYRAHILKEKWFVKTDAGEEFIIDKSNFSVRIKDITIHFDCVFNTIHGTPGEDGLFQGYLQTLKIPQTACDYYQAALTFNKRDCISVLKAHGIQTAKNVYINKGDDIDTQAIIDHVGLPCFVKANRAGSSYGISKVKKKEDILAALDHSFKEDDEVIIESFLDGREVSVGVINIGNETQALPITEIISENEFFDFEAKYLGKSKEITPANLSKAQTEEVQNLAVKIFKLLKLKGLTRSEFIFHNNEPHFLECNACPGLTEASILPQQAKAAGISLQDLFTSAIEVAIENFED